MITSPRSILEAWTEVLEQGALLLTALDDATYTRKLPAAFHASIGAHYRHCLDHYANFFTALDKAEIDYDTRQRDPRLEADRTFALQTTQSFLQQAAHVDPALMIQPINVRCKVSCQSGESPVAVSTWGREVMYCVAHAVHHYALIGVMCALQEVPLPEGFGVAPSTVEHRRKSAALEKIAA